MPLFMVINNGDGTWDVENESDGQPGHEGSLAIVGRLNGFKSAELAAIVLAGSMGLIDIAYTREQVDKIIKKAFSEGRMFDTMIQNHLGAIEPTTEQIIEEALK